MPGFARTANRHSAMLPISTSRHNQLAMALAHAQQGPRLAARPFSNSGLEVGRPLAGTSEPARHFIGAKAGAGSVEPKW
jgi:hypothetical protein